MEGGLDNLALFETTAVLHDINNFSDWVGAVCFLCAVLLLCVPCPTINIIGSCFLSCFHLLTPTSIYIYIYIYIYTYIYTYRHMGGNSIL